MPDINDLRSEEDLAAFVNGLTPPQRRELIHREPAFRDAYIKLTQAHRVAQVPRYFWDTWVPILGPVASTLYMRLRQYCYYNPDTGERRDWCWPKQETLTRDIGISDREALRKAIVLLEKHGFIERETTYHRDPATGRPHRGADKYLVHFDVPLVTGDAVELLKACRTSKQPDETEKPPHRAEAADEPSYVAEKPHHRGGGKTATKKYEEELLKNVNVDTHRGDEALRIACLTAELVDEFHDPRSRDFYHLVARRMPEDLVYVALSETRDAHRTGRIRKSPAAYFTNAIKRAAGEIGVTLSASR